MFACGHVLGGIVQGHGTRRVILWLILLSSCSVLDHKAHVEDVSALSVKELVFDPKLSDVLQKALEDVPPEFRGQTAFQLAYT